MSRHAACRERAERCERAVCRGRAACCKRAARANVRCGVARACCVSRAYRLSRVRGAVCRECAPSVASASTSARSARARCTHEPDIARGDHGMGIAPERPDRLLELVDRLGGARGDGARRGRALPPLLVKEFRSSAGGLLVFGMHVWDPFTTKGAQERVLSPGPPPCAPKNAGLVFFWFSGCWRALAKGTAWAFFVCAILLLLGCSRLGQTAPAHFPGASGGLHSAQGGAPRAGVSAALHDVAWRFLNEKSPLNFTFISGCPPQ